MEEEVEGGPVRERVDAVVEELADVVVVDVRIVAEDLMALKMRLLVVDAVMRLIEENMNMDVGVGMDTGLSMVNLGQYSHLSVCTTSSIPSFAGVHQCQVYIDESGFNIFTSDNQRPCTIRRTSPSLHSSTAEETLTSRLPYRTTWIWFTTLSNKEQSRVNELVVILALHVYLLMKKSSSSSTARGHTSTSSLFHRSSKIDSTWSCCRHIAHFSTPSSKPIAAWRVRLNNILVLPHIQVQILHIRNMRAEAGLESLSSWILERFNLNTNMVNVNKKSYIFALGLFCWKWDVKPILFMFI